MSDFTVTNFDPDVAEMRLDNRNAKLNCFINSVVIAMWHLPCIREAINKFSKLDGREKITPEHQIVHKIQVRHFNRLTFSVANF